MMYYVYKFEIILRCHFHLYNIIDVTILQKLHFFV